MSTKQHNRVTFYGEGYGRVVLVRRSIGRKWYSGPFTDPLTGETYTRSFWYWHGQLVHDWAGRGPRPGEEWGTFNKGQVVWLDAEIFHKLADWY